jgi:hypothetical protein
MTGKGMPAMDLSIASTQTLKGFRFAQLSAGL